MEMETEDDVDGNADSPIFVAQPAPFIVEFKSEIAEIAFAEKK
jgi:hypothetical protein